MVGRRSPMVGVFVNVHCNAMMDGECRASKHRRSTTILITFKCTYVLRSYLIPRHPSTLGQVTYMHHHHPSTLGQVTRIHTLHRCSAKLHEYTIAIHWRSGIHHPSMLGHRYPLALEHSPSVDVLTPSIDWCTCVGALIDQGAMIWYDTYHACV